ncbi:hypothetical protein Leryth_002978 [Lithospermum erythrorhizon]|nr:hypothetical protein Leryth_002978 [Lithospermum erythrorhizon]
MSHPKLRRLPPPSTLSPAALSFLATNLATKDSLLGASSLLSNLQNECSSLDESLSNLNNQLQIKLLDYASESEKVKGLSDDVDSLLLDLSESSKLISSDEGSWEALGEELASLAKEVARIETVRLYAETALKLDALVGDVEDSVSSAVNVTLRRHSSTKSLEDMLVVAIRTLKTMEDVLIEVTKTYPQWVRLVSAVDHRVDRALAILRPQAIADHRTFLARLGWPPPLSTSNSSDARKSRNVNPLLTIQGELKQKYFDSFLALCCLQEVQGRRKSRQLEGHNRDIALRQPLWAIEELVNPLSIASQCHFSKWTDKPEYIFALVHKIIRDYVDSMDELLQPLIDEAMLSGYSCREEWISGMVTSLSTYLAKEIFPRYVGQLDEESVTGIRSHARVSWLQLVDLMIAFDKRIKSLVEQSGLLFALSEDGNMQNISLLSVFSDRPDWLNLWAEIELSDTLDKLNPELEDAKNWSVKVEGTILSAGQEDHKSPIISNLFIQQLSSLIDRCRSLPSISLRSRFMRLTAAPIIQKFLDALLFRCQEAEGLTALTDDDALIKVSKSINAARFFESVLKDWCEDVFILEMELDQKDHSPSEVYDNSPNTSQAQGTGSGIFDLEINMLEQFKTDWVGKLATVVGRGFDAKCRDYMKNRKQWQETSNESSGVSRSLVAALDFLQMKMSMLEEALNGMDFTGVWRSLATTVDKLILHSILLSNAKFSDNGVVKLGNDFAVLVGVFRTWCMRPEGFFPRMNEGLKLLKMDKRQLQSCLAEGGTWLKENGIRHLTISDAERILKHRIS